MLRRLGFINREQSSLHCITEGKQMKRIPRRGGRRSFGLLCVTSRALE
jgi:hypothetical protein